MKKITLLSLVFVLTFCTSQAVFGQSSQITIAAMRFQNNTADTMMNHLITEIPDQVFAFMARLGGLNLVERRALEQTITELEMSRTEYIDQERAARIGKLFGATAIIVGSVTKWDENTFSINARLVSTETGLVITAESVNGTKNQMLGLCESIAISFRNTLLATRQSRKSGSLFKKWWFWTGVVAVGGTAAFIPPLFGNDEPKTSNVTILIDLPR